MYTSIPGVQLEAPHLNKLYYEASRVEDRLKKIPPFGNDHTYSLRARASKEPDGQRIIQAGTSIQELGKTVLEVTFGHTPEIPPSPVQPVIIIGKQPEKGESDSLQFDAAGLLFPEELDAPLSTVLLLGNLATRYSWDAHIDTSNIPSSYLETGKPLIYPPALDVLCRLVCNFTYDRTRFEKSSGFKEAVSMSSLRSIGQEVVLDTP